MREIKIDLDDKDQIEKLCKTIWYLSDAPLDEAVPEGFIEDVTTGLESLLPEEVT